MPARFFKKEIKKECSKCGGPLEDHRLGKYRYCNKCNAENQRLNRVPYGELSDLQKMKSNARAYLKMYIKRGKVQKEACCRCGNENAEAHHKDYYKPLEVVWLCRPCHLELHKTSSIDDFMNSMVPPTVKQKSGGCSKCGAPKDRGENQTYCKKCQAEIMRGHRAKKNEEVKKALEFYKLHNG
jgi:ribosomal protein S27AE